MVELVPKRPEVAVNSRYVVRCGDVAIEFDDTFDSATLERILQVVAPC